MSLTVGQIFKAIPTFTGNDMQKLVGSNFDESTRVSLKRIKDYSGQNEQELQTFTAQKEKRNFINLFPDNEKLQLAKQWGVQSEFEQNQNKNSMPGFIPKDQSIFNFRKPDYQSA